MDLLLNDFPTPYLIRVHPIFGFCDVSVGTAFSLIFTPAE
jgi:hypothetical protein